MTAPTIDAACANGVHEAGGGCCLDAPPSSLPMVPVMRYCACDAECITGDYCPTCGPVGPLWVAADKVTDAMTVLTEVRWPK